MDVKIDSSNAQELEIHQWYADASTLGFKPGERYPAQLATDLGNRQPFVFQRFDGNQTAIYSQALGCLTLKVWND
jgi:hypothetical protein